MAFSVGEIEATLELDRDPFQAGLDQAQTDAAEFTGQPQVVTLTLDDAEADAGLDEIRAKLEALTATPYTAVVNIVSNDGATGFEDLAAEAPAATTGLENIGAAAESTEADLANLGDTSAQTADDVGLLSSSVAPVVTGLEGLAPVLDDGEAALAAFGATADTSLASLVGLGDAAVAGTEAVGGLSPEVTALAAAADAAGLSYSDLSAVLATAGIGFEDIESRAQAAGVSVQSYAAAMAGAAAEFANVGLNDFDADVTKLEAQGSALSSFFAAVEQGAIEWDQLMPKMAGDTANFGQSLGSVGTTLGTVSQQLSAFRSMLESSNSDLLEAGTAAQQATTAARALEEGQDGIAAGLAATAAAAYDASDAFDNIEVSADIADQALLKIVESTYSIDEALGGGGGSGPAQWATSFLNAGESASSLWEAVGAGLPVIASVVTEGVGAFAALAGAATIGLTGIGVLALAAIPDLSQLESAVKDVYDGWQAQTNAAGQFLAVLQPLQDTISNVLSDISPLVQPAIKAFEDVLNVVDELAQSPDLKQFVSWLGSALGPTATTFAQTLGGFLSGLGNMLEESWPFIQMIENGMVSLSQDFDKFSTSNGFKDFIAWLQQNAGQVSSLIANIAGVVEALWEGFAKLAPVFLPVIDGVLDLVNAFLRLGPTAEILAGIGVALSGIALFATPILGVGAAIGALSGVGAAAGAGMAAGLGVAAVATVGLAAGSGVAAYEITQHWSGVQSAANDVGDWFSNSLPHFFMSGYNTVANSATDFGHQLEAGWDDVKSGASDVGDWFSNSLPNAFVSAYHAITDAGGVNGIVTTGLADGWSAIKSGASDAGDWFENSLPHAFESGYNAIGDAAKDVPGYLSDAWNGIQGGASDVGDWFSNSLPHFFESGWNDISSAASSFGSDFLSFFESLPDKLLSIGEDIIDGLWKGIETAWKDLFGWLEDAVNDIVNVFKNVLGIFSPSTVMMGLGRQTMQGFGLGLESGWEDHVAGVLASSASQVAAAFGTGFSGSGSGTSLVGALAATPTAATGTGPLTVNYGGVTVNAPTGNAPEIAAAVQAALQQHDAKLVTMIAVRSRGH